MVRYNIYKYNPSINYNPYIQVWYLDRLESEMVLDVLFYIQNNKDSTLAFRRSCREGICGSCAMNINGVNGLACIYRLDYGVDRVVNVYPLPHMPVLKDLVVNMRHFYEQYKAIDPFLKENEIYSYVKEINGKIFLTRPLYENIQFPEQRQLLDGLYECILCACCSTSCPSYWWNRDKYLGPAVLLQSFRWMVDTRDDGLLERLRWINDYYKLYRCHMILNCVQCCPKGLNPANAISNIKNLVSFL